MDSLDWYNLVFLVEIHVELAVTDVQKNKRVCEYGSGATGTTKFIQNSSFPVDQGRP